MKKIIIYSLILLFISCEKTQLSHVETAQIVVESFYQIDNSKLKQFTTTESYESFIAVQNLITSSDAGTSNFELLQETVDGNTAWVKFTTSYEDKPETFKLVQEDGKWKVTETGLREKGPF
jgi:hypothetical protein